MARRKGNQNINVRVDPGLRADMQIEAQRSFDGNESLLVRKATVDFIRLRRKLGPQYEPTIALLLGDPIGELEKVPA